MQNIEINDQFRRALDVMERTDSSAFITGRAGTGKSTLLEYFRVITAKKVVALAPTARCTTQYIFDQGYLVCNLALCDGLRSRWAGTMLTDGGIQ